MAAMAAARPTTVLLVRHGQSTWNADGRWQGHADAPLSRLGEAQAVAAAATASDWHPRPERIVASDLERAMDTATLIATALGLDAPIIDPRLREIDAGPWTGLTRPEIEAAWPGCLAEGRRPDGFEPTASVVERACASLADLHCSYPGASVLVITHGGIVRTLERALADDEGPVPNLGGRVVEVGDAGMTLGARVLLIDPATVTLTVPSQL